MPNTDARSLFRQTAALMGSESGAGHQMEKSVDPIPSGPA